MSQQPTPGDLAPDFSLSDGRSASALWGTSESGQALVVYFFPKAFTPGWNLEARGFRVAYPDIQRLNGEVIGVSPDSKETLARYAAEKELPFLFAPDPSKDLARGWGITRRLTGGIKRITVVIAPGGRVHRVIQHDLRIHLHVRESLEALEELANNE